MNRREFLALTGSGLTVVFTVRPALIDLLAQGPGRPGYPADLNAYLRIGENGRVTCLVGKVELGQGTMTSLAQLLADELDVPIGAVDMTMGDTDRCPWDVGTHGSLSVRTFGPVLRGAAAEARSILLDMAAESLTVSRDRLTAKDGVVREIGNSSRTVTFADLVRGKRIERHLDTPPPLKPPSAFTVVGTSVPRFDAIDKVTGRAKYAGDIAESGMLHARIVRPPAHGARMTSIDTSKAETVPGARVVRDGDLVAVLHERPDEATRARDLIVAQFERTAPALDDRTIFDHLVQAAPAPRVVAESGTLAEGERVASKRFEETYLNSYVAHAPIETHSALAKFEGGRVTVWASTQAPFSVKTQVARAVGVEPDAVRIITPFVGGGFGGKSSALQASEAARLAKLAGRPVQVVWDRTEEFFYDTFRPAAVVKVRSGTGQGPKIVLWDFLVYAAGEREAKSFYDVPHHRTVSHGGWQGNATPGLHPFGIGPWRAPSVNTNTFARESQIDIMAAALGVDPVAFRLSNLADPHMRRVLEAAAKTFGYTPKAGPSGRGIGVACGTDSGSYVATIAQVAVDKRTGRIRAERVVSAQDMGVVVNPDGARQQMEGCITMGLGYALTEEVRFTNGEVLEKNFDTYELPRFSWVPRIETVLIDERDRPAQGGGEPAIITMGAVVANALFDAIGARVFQLPLTPARVLAASTRTTI